MGGVDERSLWSRGEKSYMIVGDVAVVVGMK